ncbi:hypothetical protein [Acinetobacter courvalinii]|uniref:hypothetical protein n=1 Tax=Acinetobacter courvalinii TaxID=280147 RepID=UPI0028A20878|nr:hypothetical protein [Acinetobacter courvalinii]
MENKLPVSLDSCNHLVQFESLYFYLHRAPGFTGADNKKEALELLLKSAKTKTSL